MSNAKKCYFCPETERLETHHIVPKRFGGSDKQENLVDVCPSCHSKLESLYNKRFYDVLGVEKENDIEQRCDKESCTAQAVERYDAGDWYWYLCDGHNECDYGGCSKIPKHIATGDGKVTVRCGNHIKCRYGDCRSTNVDIFYKDGYNAHLLLCEPHSDSFE